MARGMSTYQWSGTSEGNETPFGPPSGRNGWTVHPAWRVAVRQCTKSCDDTEASGAEPATRRLPGGPAPGGAGSIKASVEQSWMDPRPVYAQGPYDHVSVVA